MCYFNGAGWLKLEPGFRRLYSVRSFVLTHFALCDRKRSEMRNYSVACEVTLGVCACMHWAEHMGGKRMYVGGRCMFSQLQMWTCLYPYALAQAHTWLTWPTLTLNLISFMKLNPHTLTVPAPTFAYRPVFWPVRKRSTWRTQSMCGTTGLSHVGLFCDLAVKWAS